jgi:D-alanyl-D-alanine carboxypeptidase
LPGKKILAAGTIAALLAATTAAPALAAAGPVQQALDVVTAKDGVPGAEAVIRDADGHTTAVRSGTGDLSTGQPFPVNGEFRAGSITKTFVATVVLQLVACGRVDLDAPIDRYLPGVVAGNGNDGTKITVRQLLQHTSGIPDYVGYLLGSSPEDIRHRGADPAELVALAMAHPPLFAPGTQWSYSNTNYILAGMLVEKVTGRPLATEIADRITRPLGLHGTSLPGRGDERLPTPHAVGYTGDPRIDFSDFDPSIAGAAGALVTTPDDLNRFYAALLGGRLLPPAQLAEMRHTVPAADGLPGTGYGLGLESHRLSCGGEFWGHGGSIFGFESMSGMTPGGRRVTVVANLDPMPDQAIDDLTVVVDKAFCSGQ